MPSNNKDKKNILTDPIKMNANMTAITINSKSNFFSEIKIKLLPSNKKKQTIVTIHSKVLFFSEVS